MYRYLSSIGFRNYKSKKSYSKLLDSAILEPTQKMISNFGEDILKVELIKEVGERIGFLIRGELDEFDETIIDLVIPYFKGKYILDTNEVDIEKINEKDEYYVSCEENYSGMPLSFYLQNVTEYLSVENKKDIFIEGISLSGYSEEANVLLPIEKDEIEEVLEEEEEKFRIELMKAARNGDEEAIDLLALEEEEIAYIIEERLKNEDVLSIVEGYFMPYGLKGDEYSVLATIKEVKEVKNGITGEDVFLLSLKCLGLSFEVCINKEHLTGYPEQGRRFKGIIWLQGNVIFTR
ncbi:uncharacterized protein DUF3881 [Natranaerovirga hydrolytica]|uniref:Uncharacterized protein DUF3881 n=1 Tax=Natranaerovirga hydrolytica TaxID=680378 RepID=A0A4R1M3T3_9FIRM|nr:DUF3881 family protein [Natranaerovirga hydrolytica]TCK86768.1 uncharacterized protein DUF3881 [Natranaerovirga hydrolytica]